MAHHTNLDTAVAMDIASNGDVLSRYSRGSGYVWHFGDPFGKATGQFARCEAEHGWGMCEKCGPLVFPKCNILYKPLACFECTPIVNVQVPTVSTSNAAAANDAVAAPATTAAPLAKYTRGAGYVWHFGDPFGKSSGEFARCEADHGKANCEKCGPLVFPKCKAGYKEFACYECIPIATSTASAHNQVAHDVVMSMEAMQLAKDEASTHDMASVVTVAALGGAFFALAAVFVAKKLRQGMASTAKPEERKSLLTI
ncbi:Aste57867_18775 [Aphanomyces stellatus]|uniref:Aste57867_18775 protein n=1 Tax=Aphanomyces stellatus TaxID=120398 RepID=A0A485LF79_9STRA|nr:hypothetical protein As57867_018711 [Aphanomyces stellatus]VFT95509.1 Aste57867_18775 [Aphanomyces stellatus]